MTALRTPMDDRIVDTIRRASETTRRHVLFVSRGRLAASALGELLASMPEPFARRLAKAPDGLELYEDPGEAEAMLVLVEDALADARPGFGAHALLAYRDGRVLLSQPTPDPSLHVHQELVRREAHPGFADAA